MATEMPTWREVRLPVSLELGEPVSGAELLVPARRRRRNGARRTFPRSERAGTDGVRITGVVDWDGFGLGCRA